MNIKLLKTIIANLPDNTPIVIESEDHTYRKCSIRVDTALQESSGVLIEDFGEELTPEAQYGQRIKIIVIE